MNERKRVARFGFVGSLIAAISVSGLAAHAQSGNIASNPVIERMQIRIDAMEAEIARLTGRIDAMGFEIRQARKEAGNAVNQITEMEVLIAELTARTEKIEAVVSAPGRAAEETARRIRSGEDDLVENQDGTVDTSGDYATKIQPGQLEPTIDVASRRGLLVTPDLADNAKDLFVQARQFLLQGEYPAAELAFDTFIARYPDHKNIGEAHYWLAESLFIQEAWPEAAEAYIALLEGYQATAKAPEALVRLARTLRKMGDLEQACAILRELPGKYPSASPVIVSIAATERARSRCSS